MSETEKAEPGKQGRLLPKAEGLMLPFELPLLRVVDQVSYESRYRCDGCLRSWREVCGGPVLTDDVLARICDQRPRDILCDPCIRLRFERIYHRPLRSDDLFPCPLNVISGHYQELVPARLAEWARHVVKATELIPRTVRQVRQKAESKSRRIGR